MHQKDTLINKFEKAGLTTVIIIILLRVLFGPQTNFILLVSTTLLSTYYLWFAFFILNKLKPLDLLNHEVVRSLNSFRISVSIIMGVVLSYALIGILAGFFFYPLMPVILTTSFLLLMAFCTFLITYQAIKREKLVLFKRFYYRAAIFAALLMMMSLTPLELRLEVLYKDYPEFREAYLESRANPDDEEAKEQLRQERSRFR